MGAEHRFFTFDNCPNETELRKRWREAVEEDTYQRGHDSYNGSIRHVDGPSVHPTRYPTVKEASKAADDCYVDKRDARAFAYGDAARWAFPKTERDSQLVKRLDESQKELFLFPNAVLKRFVDSKSASKRCAHCESIISKKSRAHLARLDYAKEHALFQKQGPFAARDYEAEQTSCPACGKNLLLTDTDNKRHLALRERVTELYAKVEAARKAHLAKAQPYGYLVLAVVPT